MEKHKNIVSYFKGLQERICEQIAELETQKTFQEDLWDRAGDTNISEGGGITCLLEKGEVFERAGVNFSSVAGRLPEGMSYTLTGRREKLPFYATGVSLVIHPYSPMAPTTHANVRFLEVDNQYWFGGGMDLTPYYLFEEDAVYFHQTLKNICDKHNPEYYPKFKEQCDRYFYLPHRKEARGIGGIFFDYLGKDEENVIEKYFPFVKDTGNNLMQCYLPIVQKRKDLTFSKEQKEFQLIRRGRYVEFNLILDRGTKFGLETGGRTESILMSMPPEVRWEYDYHPEKGSEEERLIKCLMSPRAWLNNKL